YSTVLQNSLVHAEARNVFGSCCVKDSCTVAVGQRPALSPPQAFTLSEEPPASLAKLRAALRSLAMTRPQCAQRNTRSDSVSSSSTQPPLKQVFEEGSHRLPTTT